VIDVLNSLAPPTDNLYKFVAIFGLVLIVGGCVLLYITVDNSLEAATRANQGFRSAIATEESPEVQEVLSEAISKMVDERRQDPGLAAALRAAGASDEAIAEAVAMQEAADVFFAHESRLRGVTGVARMLGGLGAIVSAVGFGFWYRRVQRFEDQILRRRAEATSDAAPA
jgi:hypothetical protein